MSSLCCRVIEDYAVLYFGPAMFKIARLLLVALMWAVLLDMIDLWCIYMIGLGNLSRSVHIFACMFFRVKKESAFHPDDVTTFYSSRGIDENVSLGFEPLQLSSTD